MIAAGDQKQISHSWYGGKLVHKQLMDDQTSTEQSGECLSEGYACHQAAGIILEKYTDHQMGPIWGDQTSSKEYVKFEGFSFALVSFLLTAEFCYRWAFLSPVKLNDYSLYKSSNIN